MYANGKAKYQLKKMNFKDILQEKIEHASYGQVYQKKKKVPINNFLERLEKRKSGARCWEKLGPIFGSKRRDSEASTGIDQQNQRLRH